MKVQASPSMLRREAQDRNWEFREKQGPRQAPYLNVSRTRSPSNAFILHMEKVRSRQGMEGFTDDRKAAHSHCGANSGFWAQSSLSPLHNTAIPSLQSFFTPPSTLDLTCLAWRASELLFRQSPITPTGGMRQQVPNDQRSPRYSVSHAGVSYGMLPCLLAFAHAVL